MAFLATYTTSAQSYLHFVQEYQLLHLEGGLLLPLSSFVILIWPLDSTLVGHGLPLTSFRQLKQTYTSNGLRPP